MIHQCSQTERCDYNVRTASVLFTIPIPSMPSSSVFHSCPVGMKPYCKVQQPTLIPIAFLTQSGSSDSPVLSCTATCINYFYSIETWTSKFLPRLRLPPLIKKSFIFIFFSCPCNPILTSQFRLKFKVLLWFCQSGKILELYNYLNF